MPLTLRRESEVPNGPPPVPPHEQCWAKTTERGRPGISVLQHCRTAGVVARLLTGDLPPWLVEVTLPAVGVCLAALHDIGKVSPGFQKKCAAWLTGHGIFPAMLAGTEEDHAKVGQRVLQSLLGQDSPLRFWAVIVGAHHGRLKGERLGPLADGGPAWEAERRRLVTELLRDFGPLPAAPPRGQDPWESACLWFHAGLIAVADWLASDERTFPPSLVLTDREIQERAAKQIRRLSFGLPAVPAGLRFTDLFPFPPAPLQTALVEAATGRGICVVEGPMGCGKTEAALAAAYHLMRRGQATGLYFALPTQTTSNRIHRRVEDWLQRLAPGAKTRLIHGNSWLLDGIEIATGTTEGSGAAGEGRHDGRDWFASPRRALLAPFGVGTVDQALLGVVAARHFPVRQFALAGKVVVLDEVHSYDLYTGTLVDVLVRRLRQLGATVIVLSATLTAARRRDLLGLAPGEPVSEAYPLLSCKLHESDGLGQFPVPTGPTRDVHILMRPPDHLADLCMARAEGGECVLWIRNTVDEAQGTYRQLKARNRAGGPAIGLLHARFPLFRREQLEDEWMERLGKDDRPRPANGCVLVSTQVAEQSVDIDADLLITDLAPTDMLLQRIGRLWRHERRRPPGAECRVWIAAPALDAAGFRTASASEIQAAFGRSARVYAPYVLLRSLEQWSCRDTLSLPKDIRPILEATYAPLPEEPPAWRKLRLELESRAATLRQAALSNSNPWQVPLDDDEGVQTRWNSMPSAMLLPLRRCWPLPGQNTLRALGVELLDGTACEVRTDAWDVAVARAIHRNLVRVPRWCATPGLQHGMSWLREYVGGEVAAGLVEPDGTLTFLPGGGASCLSYQPEQGVCIHRDAPAAQTRWPAGENDDDELDD
ncbi:MAG: CRISPR-associated helicase Cas3' [Lentisphaeria bacterium]|nr:CRISPR-associated helicase Cas3' [Lentisphaeria bacterium]